MSQPHHPAADTPEENSATPERHQDGPVAAVTPERIAEILTAENLEFRLDSAPVGADEAPLTVVRTGFDNMALTFAVTDGRIFAEGLWRASIPVDNAAKLLYDVNYFNQMQITPTLRFFEGADGRLAVSGVRQIPVTTGLSRNQIGVFVLTTIEAFVRAFETMEQENPELVTWTEGHHDHDHA
ncbi:YbjN domain-containing protein [Corynebacterium guangdongense]|uniref:YbjN domain-containing protein n=1 Tax=Corynebacterium guangdongense TaxID=1783348 RepID=A0ABU1ZWV9_9CORY|nr:YbjN domain-containing protein [Corynebacterium guangdongense]MDR7329423.1 hypothetical protein [Corynebacterium guangdongense]WJZ17988.1 hypothetical protein CGUA_07095 [Corynebacterium guangdongense]